MAGRGPVAGRRVLAAGVRTPAAGRPGAAGCPGAAGGAVADRPERGPTQSPGAQSPDAQGLDAGAWPDAGQERGNGHRRHHRGPADDGSAPRQHADQISRLAPYQNPKSIRLQSNECPIDSQIAGAPSTVNVTPEAEWSPKGVRVVRRNSLLRRRRRAGGGGMVRKATLDRGLRPDGSAAAEEDVHGPTEPDELTGRRPSQWRGAGGRWMVWVFRVVIWAVLLIIGFRGVMAIVQGDRPVRQQHQPGDQQQRVSRWARRGFCAAVRERLSQLQPGYRLSARQ